MFRKHRLIDPSASPEEAARRKALGDAPLFCLNVGLQEMGAAGVGDVVYVEV